MVLCVLWQREAPNRKTFEKQNELKATCADSSGKDRNRKGFWMRNGCGRQYNPLVPKILWHSMTNLRSTRLHFRFHSIGVLGNARQPEAQIRNSG